MKYLSSRGFTLLEMSIVLVIIALVTGMAMSSSISIIAQARISATQQKMKAIEDALLEYRIANDRLPCPGDNTLATTNANFGLEASNPGTCTGGSPIAANYSAAGTTNTPATAAEGALPVLTLGLPADFMFDGWGNRFRYAVDVGYTAYGAFTNTPVGCINAAITINDAISSPTRSTASVYALISHGPNGHGAYPKNGGTTLVNVNSDNTNESTNCHCTVSGSVATPNSPTYSPTYVQMAPSYSTTDKYNNFDDLVSYKERWQMQTPWDKVGSCSYVFVTDTTNHKVYKYDINGNYITSWGGGGIGNTQFSTNVQGGSGFPRGIWATSAGFLWVMDTPSLKRFDTNGNFQGLILNVGTSQFGMAADTNGYVWTSGNGVVNKYNLYGTMISSITNLSTTIDNNINVWIYDYTNTDLIELSSNGTFIASSPFANIVFGMAPTASNQILLSMGTSVQICTSPSACSVLIASGAPNN